MSYTANTGSGDRRNAGGAQRARGRGGGNAPRTRCEMCQQYHDRLTPCVYPRAQPPAVQQTNVELTNIRRMVGHHTTSIANVQTHLEQIANMQTQLGQMQTQQVGQLQDMQTQMRALQNTVRRQGDQIRGLRNDITGLRANAGHGRARGSDLAITPAAAGAVNASEQVDRKRGRGEEEDDDDERVGAAKVPKKKSKTHRAGQRVKAARERQRERDAQGGDPMDQDPPATPPLPPQPAGFQPQGAVHPLFAPPAVPQPVLAPPAVPQPGELTWSQDGFPTIDGFVFNEHWLIAHTSRNQTVDPAVDEQGVVETARMIVNQGAGFWLRVATTARTTLREPVRIAQAWREEEQTRARAQQAAEEHVRASQTAEQRAQAQALLQNAASAGLPQGDDDENQD